MRGHRRQSVCDQLHCIAHSYSGTLFFHNLLLLFCSWGTKYKKTLPVKGNVSFILLFQMYIILQQ